MDGKPGAIYEAIWARKRQDEPSAIPPGSRAAIALSLIGSGDRVLDVGCGTGVLAAALRERFATVCGVDISATAVGEARARGLTALRVNLDTEALPFPDGTFDAVTCLDVLEHVLDPRPVIREIARVCAPGATLVLTTPNMRYWRHILSIMLGRFPRTSLDEEAYDGGHLHYYTVANLADLLAPLFTIHAVRGVYGGAARGFRSALLRGMFRGQLGEELRCPGIAVCGRRTRACVRAPAADVSE